MDPKEQRRISVVIPTFNRKETLNKTLAGYRAQSLSQNQFEVIVIDDGSTDGTGELLNQLRKAESNISYYRLEHGGPARARNLGIEKASSDLILITGDDCIPHPYLLDAHLKRHADAHGICVLGQISWHPEIEVSPLMRYLERDVQFNYSSIERHKNNVPFRYFYTSNVSLPRKYLREMGGFDEDFKYAVWEDIELSYRIWKAGVRVVYEPHAKVFHHHVIALEDYLKRQYRLGLMGALLYRKHPELCELVPVGETVNPEIQHRFYHAMLDYYYFMGIQSGLMAEGELPEEAKKISVIPLEERIQNWNSLWLEKFHYRLLDARRRIRDLEELMRDKDFILKAEKENIVRRDKVIAQRDAMNDQLRRTFAQKDLLISELTQFAERVKQTLAYKAYKNIRRILRPNRL
ncbi:MAG: glycosyltransferase [Candidatus Aureabacteria bacterium]|nr:glycosyltransferase [Candidatus Auribacterota bacterium]